MKDNYFLLKLALASLATFLMLAWGLPVYAQSYIYLGEDPSKQVTWNAGQEEFTYFDWYERGHIAIAPGSWFDQQGVRKLKWGTTSGSTMENLMDTGFGQWVTHIDVPLGIEWHDIENDTGGNPNDWALRAHLAACPGSPSAFGCFGRTQYSQSWPQNASRWKRAELYVHPSYPSRQWTTTHEIGHAYGLHDQYGPGGSCNSSAYTVMDGIYCDQDYPTSTDYTRMNYFDYTAGQYDHKSTTVPYGRVIRQEWYDETWNDRELFVEYYKWNSYYWQKIGDYLWRIDIGVHRDNETRIITHEWGAPSGAGYYLICGRAWVGTKDNGTKVYAVQECGDYKYFSN